MEELRYLALYGTTACGVVRISAPEDSYLASLATMRRSGWTVVLVAGESKGPAASLQRVQQQSGAVADTVIELQEKVLNQLDLSADEGARKVREGTMT